MGWETEHPFCSSESSGMYCHHQGDEWLIAQMMEATRTSETSADIKLRTRQYIPEDSELPTRHRENLKPHILSAHHVTDETYVTNVLTLSPASGSEFLSFTAPEWWQLFLVDAPPLIGLTGEACFINVSRADALMRVQHCESLQDSQCVQDRMWPKWFPNFTSQLAKEVEP
jgi:hypothetical protein